MGAQLDYIFDPDRKEVREFATDTTESEWIEEFDLALWTEFEKIPILDKPIISRPAPKPFNIHGAITHHYQIVKKDKESGNTHLRGHTSAQEIYIQKVRISLRTALLILSKTNGGPNDTNRTIIIDAYNEFRAGKDDPYEFIAERLKGTGISSDHFEVLVAATLTKDGNPKIDRSQIEYAEDVGRGTIDSGPNKGQDLAEILRGEGYSVRETRRPENGQPIKPPQHDGYHVRDEDDDQRPYKPGIDKPEEAIDEIVEGMSEGLPCNLDKVRIEDRMATLVTYPEFKIEVEWRMVKIGCIKTKLPYFYLKKRTAKQALYSFARTEKFEKSIGDIMMGCMIEAAIAGAVIGVILLNFGAALLAFQEAANRCIKRRLIELITCYLLGLVIIKEKGSWRRA